MPGDYEIVQSRFGYRNRFHFGEDHLKFSLRDASGESVQTINYNMINLDGGSTLKLDAGRRYYAIVLVVGTAITMAIQIACPGRLDFAVAAAGISVAAYCLLRYLNVFTATFTILRPNSGAGAPIRITHDKCHDEILQRIKTGRVARLRKLHLAVNFENAPKQEARKWLLDEGAISEAKYQDATARLSSNPSGLSDDARPVVHLQ